MRTLIKQLTLNQVQFKVSRRKITHLILFWFLLITSQQALRMYTLRDVDTHPCWCICLKVTHCVNLTRINCLKQ